MATQNWEAEEVSGLQYPTGDDKLDENTITHIRKWLDGNGKIANIQRYGAVASTASSLTDVSTALNDAVTDAGVGGVVYIPPVSDPTTEFYYVEADSFNANVQGQTIFGLGYGSRIKCNQVIDGSVRPLRIMADDIEVFGLFLEGFQTGTNAGQEVLWMQKATANAGVNRINIHDLTIFNGDIGISVDENSKDIRINNIQILNTRTAMWLRQVDRLAVSNFIIKRQPFDSDDGLIQKGLLVVGCRHFAFSNGVIQDVKQLPIRVTDYHVNGAPPVDERNPCEDGHFSNITISKSADCPYTVGTLSIYARSDGTLGVKNIHFSNLTVVSDGDGIGFGTVDPSPVIQDITFDGLKVDSATTAVALDDLTTEPTLDRIRFSNFYFKSGQPVLKVNRNNANSVLRDISFARGAIEYVGDTVSSKVFLLNNVYLRMDDVSVYASNNPISAKAVSVEGGAYLFADKCKFDGGTHALAQDIVVDGLGTYAYLDKTELVRSHRSSTNGGQIREDGRWYISLADDGSTDLPSGTTGYGLAQIGDGEEYAYFSWTSAAAVTLISNSANAVNTDTDGKFCIFDNGTKVTIKNRLGATKVVRYTIWYS